MLISGLTTVPFPFRPASNALLLFQPLLLVLRPPALGFFLCFLDLGCGTGKCDPSRLPLLTFTARVSPIVVKPSCWHATIEMPYVNTGIVALGFCSYRGNMMQAAVHDRGAFQ